MDEATVLEVLAQMTKAAVAERADGSDEAGRDLTELRVRTEGTMFTLLT